MWVWEEREWKKEGRRESYRFNFFTVGLPGSVPLQQFFYRGLHSDALVHPRLICMKGIACHSCLLNTLFGADNSRLSLSTLLDSPNLLPPPKSLSPQCVSFPENKNISYFPPIIYNLSMKWLCHHIVLHHILLGALLLWLKKQHFGNTYRMLY